MQCDPKIKNRIRRCEGQLRGVLTMLEEQKDCKEVVTQLSAVRSSVDRIIALIVANNLKDAYDHDAVCDDVVQEAIDLLMKSR